MCEIVPEKDKITHSDARIAEAVERLGRRILTFEELGLSRKKVLGRCQRRTLRALHAGVYLVGTGDLTWQEEIQAAVLAGGSTARATNLSALRLYDLGNFASKPIHVEVSATTSLTATGVKPHRTRRDTAWRLVQGVPTVCVEEAMLSVAVRLPEKVLHRLITRAWRQRLTTPKRVVAYVDAHGTGVRGAKKLRKVAQLYVDHSRGPGSDAEADFLFAFYAALDAHGIEHPELQYVIDVRDGSGKLVPDFTWPKRRKIIEMKGLAAHGDYVIQDEDIEREADIRAAGWGLECVSPRAIRERPQRTIDRLIRFLLS